jgi:GIY-YIG catalytic domain
LVSFKKTLQEFEKNFFMIPPLIESDCFYSIIFIYSTNAKSTGISKKFYSNAESMEAQILNENKGLSGIYQWVNNVNGMSYTGQAIDIQKRLQEHYKSYELNQLVEKVDKFYSNIHLQRAIKKYGLNNFSTFRFIYLSLFLLVRNKI